MNIVFLTAIPPGRYSWRPSVLGDRSTSPLIRWLKRKLYKNDLSFARFSIKSWKKWAEQYDDIEVFVYDTPRHDLRQIPPSWQRWQCMKILKEQGISPANLLLVDADTIVSQKCPDLFKEFDLDKIWICRDTGNADWVAESTSLYQEFFPDIVLSPDNYFNAGVFLCGPNNFQCLKQFFEYYRENQELLKNKAQADLGLDQTIINYLCENLNLNLDYLDERYNFQHPHEKGLRGSDIINHDSYIWHFNGMPWRERYIEMRDAWQATNNNL